MTVNDAIVLIKKELNEIYSSSEISAMIRIIMGSLLNFKTTDIYLKSNDVLSVEITVQMYNIIEQLKQNMPIQYILGETEFFGLPILVDESVLIPRGETEELVDWIIKDFQAGSIKILDIGCGSGCIGIALKKHLPNAKVTGIDISSSALEIARKNCLKNDLEVQLVQADILSGVIPGLSTMDVMVSNPPYVTLEQKNEMGKNVLNYEPHLALFVPENDPLVFYRAIAILAQSKLKKQGKVYFELNEALHEETASLISSFGFTVEHRQDIHGKWRMIKGTLNG